MQTRCMFRKMLGGTSLKRFYHHLLKAGMLGIAVMLVLVMFCGYSEETAQSPAAELAEVGSFEEEQPKEEAPKTKKK